MGEHAVGWVILGLSALAVFGLLPWLLWRQWERRKPRPTHWHRGVGIIYLQGAEVPWRGLEDALDLLLDELARRWPRRLELRKDLFVEIHPYEGYLISELGMTGFVDPKTGLSAPVPTNESEARQVAKVGGTRRKVRPWMLSRWRHIAMVLQKRSQGEAWEHRLARGVGPLVPAGDSTLFHEVVQHIVPDRLGEGLNRQHTRDDLEAIERDLHRRYQREHQS